MTDTAPKRIWTTGSGETGSWNHQETRMATWVGETAYVRADLFQALTAENARLREGLSDALDALDLANELLRQTPVYFKIPLTNQFNARHAAAERGRAALQEADND